MKNVVIDTDYFRFITNELKDDSVFLHIIKILDYKPVMHGFVYKEELHEHSFVKNMVDKGIITIYDIASLTKSIEDKNEYERLFLFAYQELNGYSFSTSQRIEGYHHEKENLGEIHSVILARLMKYDLFMSNDGGAKNFIINKLNNKRNYINVINIEETFTKMISKDNSDLKWSEIKTVVRRFKNSEYKSDKEKYERIKKFWSEEFH